MITLPGHILKTRVAYLTYHHKHAKWSTRVLVEGNRLSEMPSRYLTPYEIAVVRVHKFHNDQWVVCSRRGALRRFPTKDAAMMATVMLNEQLLEELKNNQ